MTGRDRTVLIVVLVIAVIVGAWFVLIQPKRNDANRLQGQITTAQSNLAQAEAQITAGEAAKQEYAAFYTALAKLGEAIPPDDNVPSLLVQLQAAATASHVDFQNLILSAAGSSPSTLPAVGPTGAAGTVAALPPGVADGPAGIPIEAFNLTFDGNYFRMAGFLTRLKNLVALHHGKIMVRGRLMTLNAISIGPSPVGGFPAVQVAIGVTTYLSPVTPGVLAPTTTGAAGGASSSSSSSSGSSSGDFPSAAITGGTP